MLELNAVDGNGAGKYYKLFNIEPERGVEIMLEANEILESNFDFDTLYLDKDDVSDEELNLFILMIQWLIRGKRKYCKKIHVARDGLDIGEINDWYFEPSTEVVVNNFLHAFEKYGIEYDNIFTDHVETDPDVLRCLHILKIIFQDRDWRENDKVDRIFLGYAENIETVIFRTPLLPFEMKW